MFDGNERPEDARDGSSSSSHNQHAEASNTTPQHALLERFRPLPIDISASSPSSSTCREGTPRGTLPVSSLLWEGGTLWKIPFHVLGRSKRKYVRLKHGGHDRSKLRVSPQPPIQTDGGSDSPRYFAAYPLCIEWGDLDRAYPKHFFLKDVTEIRVGRRTPAFLAYMARNGSRSLPDENLCFSIVGAHRTLDFSAETSHEATLWRDALSSLLADFEEWKGRPFSPDAAPAPPSPYASKGWKAHSHAESMFASVKEGNVEAFHWHLDRGCPVDFMEEITGDTPLIAACRLGIHLVVKLALEYGAKNDPHPDFGQTALHVAVSTGNTSCTRLILETAAPSGSDVIIVNHEDSNKEAPLHIASRCGNLAILELLVLHGANMRLVEASGRTSLHCSAQNGHSGCLGYLLDAGGDSLVEERDNHGLTCMHLAVRANRMDCVRVLLEAAADVMAATFDGLTAIEIARRQKSQQMMRMLEEYEYALESKESLPRPHSPSGASGDTIVHARKRKDELFEGLDLFTVTCSPPSVDGNNSTEQFGQLQKYIGLQPSSRNQDKSQFEGAISPGLISSSHSSRMPPSPQSSSVFRNGEGSAYSVGDSVHEQGVIPRNHFRSDSVHQAQAYRGGFAPAPFDLIPGTEEVMSGVCDPQEFHIDNDMWMLQFDSGYPYFLRVRDGHSQWEDPRHQLQFAAATTANVSPTGITSGAPSYDGETFYSPQTSAQDVDISQTEYVSHTTGTLTSTRDAEEMNSGRRLAGPSPSKVAQVLSATERAEPNDSTGQKTDREAATANVPADNDSHVELDSSLSRYVRMASVGVPMASVLHKMTQDGVDETKIKSFAANHEVEQADTPKSARVALPAPPSAEIATKVTDGESDLVLVKYSKMISVGVPPDSVVHKMKADGVCPSKIDLFVRRNGLDVQSAANKKGPRETSSDDQVPCPSKEDLKKDEVLSKFVKMAAVGVPPAAVVSKMSLENVSDEKVLMFKRVFGLASKDEAGQKRKFSQSGGQPLPPCPPPGRRPTIKMQKIHWKPVSEEKLHDSLWASGDFAENDVDQAELEQLESLFGAKPIKAKKKVVSTKKEKVEVRLIELKRANNVAISLAQFRAFTNYDELCQAVVVQDQEHLNTERLMNLQTLLPTTHELDTIKRHKGGAEGLGSAELFFFAVSKVPRFAPKLQAFLSALQFPDQVKDSIQSLELLGRACAQVTESQKLAAMLRRLLVVGNIMNESSGKPKAAGITLDSLLKTANKKGSDGKTTVLDHVVATLMKQGDPENTIDFWKYMHGVRDAIRIDIREVRTVFKELQVRTKMVQSTTELEEKIVEQGSAQNTVKFIECGHSFTVTAKQSLVEIEIQLKDVEEKVKSLCSFFAEDSSLCQSTSIFRVLVEFAKLVDRSKESWGRKERAEKRRATMNTPIKTTRGTPKKSKPQNADRAETKRSSNKQDGRSLLLQSISQRRLSMPCDS